MVQKAVVIDLCDMCMPVETPATIVMVAQINGTEYKLDLCDRHASEYSIGRITQLGRHENASPTGKPKVECRWCGKHYAKGSGLALHIKANHSKEVGQ